MMNLVRFGKLAAITKPCRLWLVLALMCVLPATAQSGREPIVAAASSLQFVLPEIVELFRFRSGHSIKLSFGSSGNFARQIRQGAPYDVFFSADERYVDELYRDGFTRDAGLVYAMGRVAVIAPRDSRLNVDAALAGLESMLASGQLTYFAIANPEHAPYGRRAREVLQHHGLWEAIQPHLLIGENVSQAAQFAVSGSAQGGIIAYSLALSPRVSKRGHHALLAEESHSPLRQKMALLKKADSVAEQFYRFFQQAEVRAILLDYGFTLPPGGD